METCSCCSKLCVDPFIFTRPSLGLDNYVVCRACAEGMVIRHVVLSKEPEPAAPTVTMMDGRGNLFRLNVTKAPFGFSCWMQIPRHPHIQVMAFGEKEQEAQDRMKAFLMADTNASTRVIN